MNADTEHLDLRTLTEMKMLFMRQARAHQEVIEVYEQYHALTRQPVMKKFCEQVVGINKGYQQAALSNNREVSGAIAHISREFERIRGD